MLLGAIIFVAFAGVGGQQCETIDGIRSESWLLERAARATGTSGPPPFPAFNKVTRVLGGAGLGLCAAVAHLGPRAPHQAENLCVNTDPNSEVKCPSEPSETEPCNAPCKLVKLCSPGRDQYFSYPFWSEFLDIKAAEAKNPREFGSQKRTDVKACLTCYALAKPPIPETLTAEDDRKQSVTVSTRVACGQPLSDGSAYFGPNAQQREQLKALDARLKTCPLQPGCNPQQLQAQREQFLASFQLQKDGEAVNGHKRTLSEIPYNQARVFQTEVDMSGAPGALLTTIPLPTGMVYPPGIGVNTCSAFEYGMVVVSPGRIATSCWLTPIFDSAAARNAYLDKEYAAEEAIQTQHRRAQAKQCRQAFGKASQALNNYAQQRRFNPQARPNPVVSVVPQCILFCKTTKAALPPTHNFIRQPKAYPDLCEKKYLPLEATLQSLQPQQG